MKVKTTAYLILEPHRNYLGFVESISIENMTRREPNLKSSQVALKINVEVDSILFEQFIPEATIAIRDGRVLITPDVSIEEPPEEPAQIEAGDAR